MAWTADVSVEAPCQLRLEPCCQGVLPCLCAMAVVAPAAQALFWSTAGEGWASGVRKMEAVHETGAMAHTLQVWG